MRRHAPWSRKRSRRSPARYPPASSRPRTPRAQRCADCARWKLLRRLEAFSFFLAENLQQLHHPLERLAHLFDFDVLVNAVHADGFLRIEFYTGETVGG